MDPKEVSYYRAREILLEAKGNYRDALEDMNMIISLTPNKKAKLYFQRANIKQILGDVKGG